MTAPAELVASYKAGATIREVGDQHRLGYAAVRRVLLGEGVALRTSLRAGTLTAPRPSRCGDCGEDLRHPHVLGAHLPGCARSPEELVALAGKLSARMGTRTAKGRRR